MQSGAKAGWLTRGSQASDTKTNKRRNDKADESKTHVNDRQRTCVEGGSAGVTTLDSEWLTRGGSGKKSAGERRSSVRASAESGGKEGGDWMIRGGAGSGSIGGMSRRGVSSGTIKVGSKLSMHGARKASPTKRQGQAGGGGGGDGTELMKDIYNDPAGAPMSPPRDSLSGFEGNGMSSHTKILNEPGPLMQGRFNDTVVFPDTKGSTQFYLPTGPNMLPPPHAARLVGGGGEEGANGKERGSVGGSRGSTTALIKSKGAKGSKGSEGSKEAKGAKGAKGGEELGAKSPKGAKGAKDANGAKGAKGAKGDRERRGHNGGGRCEGKGGASTVALDASSFRSLINP